MSTPPSTSSSTSRRSSSIRFIEHYLSRGRSSPLIGLLLGQLDAFNRISTTFGHERAESFCAEHAEALRRRLPGNTPVIRLSERRFAALIGMDSMTTIIDVAADIAERQQPQIQVGDDSFLVDVTLGVAVFPTHSDDAATLFRRAELALAEAREKELTFEIYRQDATQQQTAMWKFASDLEKAVQHGELEVYYQPKLSLADGRIHGAEALVRWRRASGHLIAPSEFIPLAERSGSIVPITWLVFEAVAETAPGWKDLEKPFAVAINVSPHVLVHTDFPAQLEALKAVLDGLGVKLTLELTEDSLLESEDASPAKLRRIEKLGVDLAIDDFGKGYSSLAYLKNLPASEIKIDKRFIGTIAFDEKDQHIVKAVIDLAHAFGMRVVAEGVDSEENLAAIEALGCEAAQGFFIARPMRADMLVDWIAGYSHPASARLARPIKGDAATGLG